MTTLNEYVEQLVLEKRQIQEQAQQQTQVLAALVGILWEGVDKNVFTFEELEAAPKTIIKVAQEGVTLEYSNES